MSSATFWTAVLFSPVGAWKAETPAFASDQKKTEVTGGSYTKCMKLSYYISNIIVISNNYENFWSTCGSLEPAAAYVLKLSEV